MWGYQEQKRAYTIWLIALICYPVVILISTFIIRNNLNWFSYLCLIIDGVLLTFCITRIKLMRQQLKKELMKEVFEKLK